VKNAEELDAAFAFLYHNEKVRLQLQDTMLDYVHGQAGATTRILRVLSMKP
jgi:3-deoxy-D-manno-octulosonic-acid transferase